MTLLEKLYDYNTQLTNEDRCEIAEGVEELLASLKDAGYAILMSSNHISNSVVDVKLLTKVTEIRELLDKHNQDFPV